MKMRYTLQLPVLAAVLAGGVSLVAQTTTGAVRGRVTDEAGRPVAGARIAFESPALFQTRTVVSEAGGAYHALLLPVGNYTIRVSAEGKLGKTVKDFRVGVGSDLSLPFVLKSQETASAVVEVTSTTTAAEAKTSDKVSVNYSAEQLLKLPVSMRGFDDITNMAPGVAGYGTGARVRGSDANQILYSIDGINVKDDSGLAASLYAPLPDSIEDVQVVSSALNARNGLVSGGQVNMVTKSGSNSFEGTVRANMSRASMGADYYLTNASNNSNLLREDLTHTLDVLLSGPILKDRLWFTLGTRFTPSQATTGLLGYTVTGIRAGQSSPIPWNTVSTMLHPMSTYGLNPGVDSAVNAGPGGNYIVSPEDAGTQLSSSIRFRKLEGKLTGMVTPNHALSVTYLTEKTTQGGVQGQKNTDPWEGNILRGIGSMTTETKAYTLSWNGVLAPNWTVEARATHADVSAYDVPNPKPGVAVAGYFSTGDPTLMLRGETGPHSWLGSPDSYDFGPLLTNMSTYINPLKRGNDTVSVNVKTIQDFHGSHDIDLGIERVATLYNFGRTKYGNRGVFTGGWYLDPSTGQYLYPVFRRGEPGTDPTEILQIGPGEDPVANGWAAWGNMPNGLGTQAPFIHWEAIRGPSAHMERFFDNPGDSRNSTTSFYANDNWTVNANWNLMVGARFNKLVMEDQGGNKLQDMTIFEPRFLLKFNPDGQNKEVYSISVAKLASAYSDAIANNFRGNAWEVRTVHLWSGAALGTLQPGFDTPGAASDAPVGTYNGYTYTGQNMNGVRFVDYATLTNPDNYGPAYDMLDARQTYLAPGLRAPYAIEVGLGYLRNYDTGYFRLNATRRVYKDNIVGPIHDYGMDSMVHMVSPAPGDPLRMWKQKTMWLNSEFNRIYTGLEVAFQKQLSSRWSVMGSYTWDQSTGTNDLDYYNYKTLREKLLTPAQQKAAVGQGVLSRNQISHLFLTYTLPVGKGNVSFSLKADTWTGGVIQAQGWTDYRTLPGFANLQLPTTIGGQRVIDVDQRTGNWQTFFPTYYGDMGAFKTGVDYYQVGAQLQWDIPLGVGKVHLIGYVKVDNIFNHMVMTNVYGYFTGDSPNQNANVAPGSPMALFISNRYYGQTPGDVGAKYGDYNLGYGGRRVGDFSIGFKF
ncbi:TonB-dependent receptor [Geothrix sp. SG200]|uniref:TonB-dependent receptor n=1 Tax=Geothrix sp. SG200 TaxID=2922865 RepID=UPI001FAD404C|nr:TonB-dependent receptor [Geothrix sp. SG200]